MSFTVYVILVSKMSHNYSIKLGIITKCTNCIGLYSISKFTNRIGLILFFIISLSLLVNIVNIFNFKI